MIKSVQLLTLAVFTIQTLSATLVTNGSFEDPAVQPGTVAFFDSIPGWNLSSGESIEVQHNFNGPAYAGLQHLELDSEENSAVYQDLATGFSPVTLTFAFAPRPGRAENSIQVLWNGSLVDTVDADGSALTTTAWTVHTYNLVGTGPLTRLEFVATGTSDSFGAYIDDVAVTTAAVPEPMSLALLGSGGAALILLRRLRSLQRN